MLRYLALSVTTSLALFAGTTTYAAKTIVETAVEAGSFNTLAAALQAGGLVDALQGEGPFTVFAPTDEAFANLPEGTVESLLKPENQEQLVSILTFHVVSGSLPAEKVVASSGALSLNGQRIDFEVDQGAAYANGATITATDIACSNGIIHVIDEVILPESKAIPAVAAAAKIFGTLWTAVTTAGLGETLTEGGPFTVFAPTDDAFAKLPEGTVASLLKPENRAKLQAILKYHVVAGRIYSDQALVEGSATTLEGSPVKIGIENGAAQVSGANLVATDIDAANGVIHVIDSVLLPPDRTEKRQTSITPARHHVAAPCGSGKTVHVSTRAVRTYRVQYRQAPCGSR